MKQVTQKVLGNISQVRSKLFETTTRDDNTEDTQVPAALQNMKDFNATAKSTTTNNGPSKPGRTLKRGNSVSSLSHADKF